MKKLLKKIEDMMAATAFAEANDERGALTMMGIDPDTARRVTFDDMMVAATFAEANAHDHAREYLGVEKPDPIQEILGVKGVKIWFGTAAVAVE